MGTVNIKTAFEDCANDCKWVVLEPSFADVRKYQCKHYEVCQQAVDRLKATPYKYDAKYHIKCGECAYWNSETHGCTRNPSVEAWYEEDYCSYAMHNDVTTKDCGGDDGDERHILEKKIMQGIDKLAMLADALQP